MVGCVVDACGLYLVFPHVDFAMAECAVPFEVVEGSADCSVEGQAEITVVAADSFDLRYYKEECSSVVACLLCIAEEVGYYSVVEGNSEVVVHWESVDYLVYSHVKIGLVRN